MLLSPGLSRAIQTRRFQSPLAAAFECWAPSHEYLLKEMISVLVNAKANPNNALSSTRTPALAQLLLEAKAVVSFHALECAVDQGNVDILGMLLRHQTFESVVLENSAGESVVDVAYNCTLPTVKQCVRLFYKHVSARLCSYLGFSNLAAVPFVRLVMDYAIPNKELQVQRDVLWTSILSVSFPYPCP